MPTYSITSGSYDGCVRTYDIRKGQTNVDVLAHPVTSVRCSTDGNALLASTLDGRIRMLDRADGSLLKAFGGGGGSGSGSGNGDEKDSTGTGPRPAGATTPRYVNSEMRIRSVFAKGDGVVLSGGECEKGYSQASVFAWDVLSGEVVGRVGAGNGVRVVGCVGWNEKGGCWAGGCSDGGLFSISLSLSLLGELHCMQLISLCLFRECQGLWAWLIRSTYPSLFRFELSLWLYGSCQIYHTCLIGIIHTMPPLGRLLAVAQTTQ